MRFRRELMIIGIAILMVLVLASSHSVTAKEIDDGDGGGSGDNAVLNPGFETGDLTTWTDEGGAGSASVTSSKKYEGSYSLALKDVKPTLSIVPLPKLHIVSKTTSIPIQSTTVIGGAMYVHGNPLYLFTAIGIHITPADVWLVYYVKGGSDEPDWGNKILEKVGSTKDTWHHFYSNVASDLSAADISYSGQTINEIELHVESISILTDVVDGYFDDLYIGSTPPSLEIDAPTDNQWISGTYRFNGDAWDNRGEGYRYTHYMIDPTDYQLLLFPFYWTSTGGTTDWYVDVDTTEYEEGSHRFYVYATDVTGTTVRRDIDFRVDNTDPTLSISSPSSNTWVKGTVTISGTANDAPSGLSLVRYRIDDGGWVSLGSTTSWSFDWDSTSVDDGSHSITVQAVDLAGNTKASTITLKVDNSGPTITSPIVTPIYGPDSTTFVINFASVSDGTGSGVNCIIAYILDPNGNPIEVDFNISINGDWEGTLSFDSNGLEGTYTIESITAIDNVGNPTTITTDLFFVYDRTLPTVTLTSHSSHATLVGDVTLSGALYDAHAGLDTFKIFIDGVLVYEDDTPTQSWEYALDTSFLPDGYHVFHFLVSDRAGNSKRLVAYLIVQNGSEDTSPFIPIINDNGDYLSRCRVTMGDSQLTLIGNIPNYYPGNTIRLLIAPPFIDRWHLVDITYLDINDNPVHFVDYVTWDPASHEMNFPSRILQVSLQQKTIIAHISKESLVWTLSYASDDMIMQNELVTIGFTIENVDGATPYGPSLSASLYIVQDGTRYHIASSMIGVDGDVTFTFSIGTSLILNAGSVAFQVELDEPVYTIHDMTTIISSLFNGFSFFQAASWEFYPSDDPLIHYTATMYDQRLVTIRVYLVDGYGSVDAMIGQGIEVHIIGASMDEIFIVYQALYVDGTYALIQFNLTEVGDYLLTADFLPSGCYADIESREITIRLEGLRPVAMDLSSTPDIQVGSVVILEANVTDAFSGGFPIEGMTVTFSYEYDGSIFTIGTAVTDGFGIARYIWIPDTSEWIAIAGKSIVFNAISPETTVYQEATSSLTRQIGLVSTYFERPFVIPHQIDAGESITFNITVFDQFGQILMGLVEVTILYPDGQIAVYSVILGENSTFTHLLEIRGTYQVDLLFSGNTQYAGCQEVDLVEVMGIDTVIDFAVSPGVDAVTSGESFTITFYALTSLGDPISGLPLSVMIYWQGSSTSYDLVSGIYNEITFTLDTYGNLMFLCEFTGDDQYEPSSFESTIYVNRRDLAVLLTEPPAEVYPYVGPSEISYILTAEVLDAVSNTPVYNVTVLFCYIADNVSVYLPIMNATGHINLTAVNEYLAWGLFRSIGSTSTDIYGKAQVEWQVEAMSNQELRIFALTFQTDIFATCISEIYEIQFSKISTITDVNAEWTGEELISQIDVALWDEFNYFLYGKTLGMNISSIANPNYQTTLLIVTGMNHSFTWIAPEYGAYEVVVWFDGDAYYDDSNIGTAVFVVSWRHVSIELDMVDSAYTGELLTLTAVVEDMNSTPGLPLLEELTVYFVLIEHGIGVVIGSDVTDSDNMAAIQWEAPIPGHYRVYAFIRRQTIYDSGVSNFEELHVQYIDTYLNISYVRNVKCWFDYTYTIHVGLADQFGKELAGEAVTLYLTDNYTLLWYQIVNGLCDSIDCLECGDINDFIFHLYKFTVIIGVNDTFTWSIPESLAERFLFAQRAFAYAEYEGNDIYLPTATNRKMSDWLIQTNLDVSFSSDKLNLVAGQSETITINVTDEDGEQIFVGFASLSIIGPDGSITEYIIDLNANWTFSWTPNASGRYVFEFEYSGGTSPHWYQCRCHGTSHWKFSAFYYIRLTRSLSIEGVVVNPSPVAMMMDAIPSVLYTDESIILQASARASDGQSLSNILIRFYIIDTNGQITEIGSNYTSIDGIALLKFVVPDYSSMPGYETLYFFAEVDSITYRGMTEPSSSLSKVWPPLPATMQVNPLSVEFESFGPPLHCDLSGYIALCFMLVMVAVPMKTLARVNKRWFVYLFLAFAFFLMTSILYTSMGLESYNHPFEADLISSVATGPEGVQSASESNKYELPHEFLATPLSNSGTLSSLSSLSNEEFATAEDEEVANPFASTMPNASFVVIPLRKTLDVNFTATGHYVVTVLDESKNPVDTVAGFIDGTETVSFYISPSKYSSGQQYTVNIFVTVQSGGIIYGDTSWVILFVSRTPTYMDFITADTVQTQSGSVSIPLTARLTRVHENTSIAGAEIEFSYRTATDITWYALGSAMTSEYGLANYVWEDVLPKGSYIVNATFAGNSDYDASTTARVIEVQGASTVLTFAPNQKSQYVTQYGQPFTMYAQLKDYLNTPLADRLVDFSLIIDDLDYWLGSNSTNSNGVASFTYVPVMPEDVYRLSASFEGDEYYAPSKLTYENGLSLFKRTCIFQESLAVEGVSGRTVLLSAPIFDTLGRPIVRTNAYYEIYEPSKRSWTTIAETETDLGGYAIAEYIIVQSPGMYVLRLVVPGDRVTATTSLQGVLRVLPVRSSVYILPVEGIYGSKVTLSAHLEDHNGDPLVGQSLLFSVEIEDDWHLIGSAITSTEGWADLVWLVELGEGTYRMKVAYPGNVYNSPSEFITTGLSVDKSSTTLTLSVPEQAHITMPLTFNIYLKDESGVGLLGREIGIHVVPAHGISTEVTLITDEWGFAAFTYVPAYLGFYAVGAVFTGDTFYYQAMADSSFEAGKLPVAISLVLSAYSGHRGDRIHFSGTASIRIASTGECFPLDPGISFDMYLEENPSLPLTYTLDTKEGGLLEGYFIVPASLLAREYAFVIETPPGPYEGSSSFMIDVILKTTLTVTALYQTVNGVQTTKPYVDIPVSFEFDLKDEDGVRLTQYPLDVDMNGTGLRALAADVNGDWITDDFTPRQASGFFITGDFIGARFLDPATSTMRLQTQRREVEFTVASSSSYVHRNDIIDVTISGTDLLTGSPYEGELDFDFYVDGKIIQSYEGASGVHTIPVSLPEYLTAGQHKLTVRSHLGRLYKTSDISFLMDAYVFSHLRLSVDDEFSKDESPEMYVTLTDEDGIALPGRLVMIEVQIPNGTFEIELLTTDSMGRAASILDYSIGGEYYFNSEYEGEYFYTESSSVEKEATVIDDTVPNDVGISPLWLLPLILAIVAVAVMEALTYGLMSFMWLKFPYADGYMTFFKYSYPWIELQETRIWLPIIGWTTVLIPVLVVRGEFSFEIDDGYSTFSMNVEDGALGAFLLNGGSVFDTLFDSWDKMVDEPVSSPSPTYVSPDMGPPSSAETSILSYVLTAQNEEPQPKVKILTPEYGERVAGTIRVAAQISDAEVIDSVKLYADGDFVADMTAVSGEPGVYEANWDTTVGDTFLFPQYSIGPHRLTVVADVGAEEIDKSSVVNVMNWAPVISGFIFGLVIQLLFVFIETKIVEHFSSTWVSSPDPATRIGMEVLKALILFIITYAILDIIASLVLAACGKYLLLYLGIGLIWSIILFVIGYLILKNKTSGYASKETNWEQRWGFALRVFIAPLAGDILGDIIGDLIQTHATGALGDTGANVIGGLVGTLMGAAGTLIGLILGGRFLKKEFSRVSTQMQSSIAKQGIALAVMAGGASMLYKTLKMVAFKNGVWWY